MGKFAAGNCNAVDSGSDLCLDSDWDWDWSFGLDSALHSGRDLSRIAAAVQGDLAKDIAAAGHKMWL